MLERVIEFRDVALGYGRKTVLRGVNVCIGQGDFFGLVGPNGSGKTTLLRALLGILKPYQGDIQRTKPQGAMELVYGYVPQEKEVDPMFPLSILEVVLMGRFKLLGPGRRPGSEDRRVALESLTHVGLDGLAKASFQELSGGQKQRVLMARALAAEPNVLVLDEPTSGMDLAAEKQLMELIQDLHEKERLTTILATHNLNLVAQSAHQLAIFSQGELLVGETMTLLSEQRLRQIYQINVTVQEIDGRRWVI